MTREYAKNREEYFREFHSVVAPVVVVDGYDYERKYKNKRKNGSPEKMQKFIFLNICEFL